MDGSILSWDCRPKKTAKGRRLFRRALRPLVPGLGHPRAFEHQLDAVVCVLTAHMCREGRTRTVGVPDEGVMTFPDVSVPPMS